MELPPPPPPARTPFSGRDQRPSPRRYAIGGLTSSTPIAVFITPPGSKLGGLGIGGTKIPVEPGDNDDDDDTTCTDDQVAIATEYDLHMIGGDWPCEKFTHGVTPGRGTHGHATGYLTGLKHVEGRAGDFRAPGFLDEPDGADATPDEEAAARALHRKFVEAAQAAMARFSAFGQNGTHKDHIHIFL